MSELYNFKIRCGNCGKYPFCNKTNGANDFCNEWIRENLEEKINNGDKRNNDSK